MVLKKGLSFVKIKLCLQQLRVGRLWYWDYILHILAVEDFSVLHLSCNRVGPTEVTL
jgi:hypothetical protein